MSLLQAQLLHRYNSFSYSVNEGLLQSTIADMAFDRNNFWWISYPNGIQRFDGKNFTAVDVQQGLPENTDCHFFKSGNGDLLISHQLGISLYDHTSSRFKLVYENKRPTSIKFIGESDGVIYFYTDEALITGINATSFKLHSSFKTGLPEYKTDFNYAPKISDNIINGQAAFIVDKRIYKWDLKKGAIVFRSGLFKDISTFLLRQMSENELLFFTYKPTGTLTVLHTETNSTRLIQPEGYKKTLIGRSNVYRWQNRILFSINDRIYETDQHLSKLQSEIVNFHNDPVCAGNVVAGFKEDVYGNLYIQTIAGGFYKIAANNYPFKYFTTGEKGNNYTLTVFADKARNRILAGTVNNGLQVYDTLQHLVKQIPLAGADTKLQSPNTIVKDNTGGYFIFTVNARGVWHLGSDLKRTTFIPLQSTLPANESGIGYFCKLLYQDKERAVVLSQSKIYQLDFNHQTVHEYPSYNGYIMSGMYCNPYFLIHCNDEFVFLNEKNFQPVKKRPFRNTGGVRCYLKGKNGKMYTGTNKGIFVTDTSGKLLQQFNSESGLPDECIYAMTFDDENNLWCSTNKGIIKLKEGKVTEQFKKEDGLQENEFNTGVVTRSDDGELFFGGVNGVSSFYPSTIETPNDHPRLLFTRITANNENAADGIATWNLQQLQLPYTRNSLAFDFVAMGIFKADQYRYQYRMKGVDKNWIPNSDMQTVRYSLQPGQYIFQVFAARTYNENAIPMKELVIIIYPPFWKTWWFITLLVFFIAVSFAFIINSSNKRKYARQLQQLESERQLKEERERISKDLHDSLGAYANAVLYNTEMLEREKEPDRRRQILGDLKFASKDIITSLRETVWALKKELYSAEDCMVRIRNFVQALARYYNHITFAIEGEAPSSFCLHYVSALNLVRIMQEAVTNSIKHARPAKITIVSRCADDKWILAVTDNGDGFVPGAVTEEGGNGLHNMKSRAAASGFNLQVTSEIGKGTQITITV